ncbi:Bug family tripartite tricarboxylate transporter substrate binding protein [Ramlibacter sp. MAHUQ-53]|uniref:Bug family tripartite tricarboxylate transporter substrate binding protein n=1 Tax=unclassified Ramlibacter TaxID=2617605 RepID=UPI00364331A0
MRSSLNKRDFLKAAGATAAAAVAPGLARAQAGFPNRPIKVIVPYAAGGTTDIVGRRMAQRMSELLGQPVVVENRTGANTAIGAEAVAKSAPDGHTLLFTNDATFVANPVLYPQLSYNVQRDFVPVAPVTYVALALAVAGNTPANDMKELIAYMRSRKDLSYGSFGAGSQPHLMGEMLKKLTGADLVHVPYRGAAPAITDVMSGQILLTFPAFPTIQGHLGSGKIKLLAVSGDKRVPAAPQVPTLTEAGLKEMDMGAWYAFLAPAGTPRDVVAKLNATVNTILADKEFVEKNMTSQGMAPMVMSPEQMAALIRSETASTADYVKKSGARVE